MFPIYNGPSQPFSLAYLSFSEASLPGETELHYLARNSAENNRISGLLTQYANSFLNGGKEKILVLNSTGKTFIEYESLSRKERIKYLEILYKVFKTYTDEHVGELREVLLKVLSFYGLHKSSVYREMVEDKRLLPDYGVAMCEVQHPMVAEMDTFYSGYVGPPIDINLVKSVAKLKIATFNFLNRKGPLIDFYEEGKFEADIQAMQKEVLTVVTERGIFNGFVRIENQGDLAGFSLCLANLEGMQTREGAIQKIKQEVRLMVLQKIVSLDVPGKVHRMARPLLEHFVRGKLQQVDNGLIADVTCFVINQCKDNGEFWHLSNEQAYKVKLAISTYVQKLYYQMLNNRSLSISI
ncbi:hypothetical protein PARA125_000169 [Parachlamydia sp. AcF125]|nr:hypothetical protein [Parachlamydia sp. AcF125]